MGRAVPLLIATIRRIAGGILLLVGASFLIYMTIRSAPGDAIDAISPMGTPPEIKAQLLAEYGLDRDPVTGYVAWLGNSAGGDFGESLVIAPGESVMALAAPTFKRTLLLSALSLLVCLFLSIIGALLLGEPTRREQLVTGPLYILTAAPSFVLAVVFAQGMNWAIDTYVQAEGYVTPEWFPIPIYSDSLMPYVFAGFVLIVGDGLFMDFLNQVRSDLLALRNAQFIAAVRAKGARTMGHIARNMIVPLIAAYAARLPVVLGGVVIVEYIFTLEGAGYLLLEASRERDFPLVVGLSVLFTATIIGVNLFADMIRAIVDPREASHGG